MKKYLFIMLLPFVIMAQDTLKVPMDVFQSIIKNNEQGIVLKTNELEQLKGELTMLYKLNNYHQQQLQIVADSLKAQEVRKKKK